MEFVNGSCSCDSLAKNLWQMQHDKQPRLIRPERLDSSRTELQEAVERAVSSNPGYRYCPRQQPAVLRQRS